MFYITNHKNPDTDSIVSAIVMEDYFKKTEQKAKAVRVGRINKETQFVLNKVKVKPPQLMENLAGKFCFLVDHNELEQAGKGIEKAEIVGVLDHHKLGGIKNEKPIYFRIEPVGSTSTLVFKLFQEKKIVLNKKQSFLLLCGIISDTLKFNSPTTTDEDVKTAKKLSKFCGEKINNLAEKMFEAKSDISGINLKDLVFSDYKEFKKKGINFGIGVCETVKPESVLNKKEEILKLVNQAKKNKKMDLIFFGAVDILKKQTYLFTASEQEKKIAEKAFKKREKDNLIFLPGVVSRKKQIAPGILGTL